MFCRRAFLLPNGCASPEGLSAFWPEPKAEALFRRVVEAEQRLVLPLARAILHAVGEPNVHLLDSDLTHSNFGFRLNYYPPMSAEALAAGAGRMLGHEDVDLFTLLPASPVEGLQVGDVIEQCD